MRINGRSAAGLLPGILLVAAACGPAELDQIGVPAAPSPAVGAAVPGDVAMQGDLWATYMTGLQGGVAGGEFALTRTQDPAVRAYAQRLVDDYGRAGAQWDRVMGRQRITATPGVGADQLRQSQQRAQQAFQDLQGTDFDRRWIDHQIATHRWMLDTIDRSYMPAATGRADMQTELRMLRGTIRGHLMEAERVRAGWNP